MAFSSTTERIQNEDGTVTLKTTTTVVKETFKSFPPNPTTWGDVLNFVDVMGYADDEYFSLDRELTLDSPLYNESTWYIAVYAVTGGSEGYYVHVDQLQRERNVGENEHCHMLGKFWSSERAQEVVTAVTKYINGWK